MPIHMHVAEQPREIEECLRETGRRPVEHLAERGVLSRRFVAVHATHLGPGEARLLGEAGAFACLCPTTERDLGDGLPDLGALVGAGVRLSVGVDSHVATQPLEDLREVELHERLRTGKRVVLPTSDGVTPAERLWQMGSIEEAYAKSSAGRHLARHYVQRKEYDKAVEFYREALRAEGLSAVANREMLRELAQVYLLKKDYAAAAQTLQQALALDLEPDLADRLCLAGRGPVRAKLRQEGLEALDLLVVLLLGTWHAARSFRSGNGCVAQAAARATDSQCYAAATTLLASGPFAPSRPRG